MLKAEYQSRGPRPDHLIRPVPLKLPELSAGQALVEVTAAPINPSDVLTITGDYGMLPPLPAVAGNEGVGRIAELGSSTDHLSVGQTVLLPIGSGTWVSHMVSEAKDLVPLPEGVDHRQLAMIAINPPTAALLLSEIVDLEAGDWVIQNAANSGVGSYLNQIANERGIRVLNVVRRDSAIASVNESGGETVLIDGPDLKQQATELTDKMPIKLAIDAVGGSATGRLADCLGDGGVVANYGLMSGEPCKISADALIFRDVTLRGFWLARWFQSATAEKRNALFAQLAQWIALGTLKAPVHATFDIEHVQEAVACAMQSERNGKVLLEPKT